MRRLPAAAALVLLIATAGCDTENGDGSTVSATTGIWADVTERIAGEDATVQQVIPDGVSPHDFQLSARDRAEIEDSLLLVHNGAGLEAGIPIDDLDVRKFAAADHVGELETLGDEGDGVDPHVWMDPSRVADAVPALAEELAGADPEHAAGYRARGSAYAAELRDLDAQIRSTLETVPPDRRKLVTSHDALEYFAAAYGFEVIATPFPASGPEAEPVAATIDEVEQAIRASGVSTVFAQDTDNPEVLDAIASRTGVRIEDELPVEAPGESGSYIGMLRRDAELIAAGLRGP